MSLQALILLVLKISIVLMVLSLGLNATLADAIYLFRRPRELGRAFVCMNVVMPLLALILAMTFNLHPAVKIALGALSVSPVPPFFPKTAAKTGCKEDYAVGLLVGTAILAVFVIPVTLEIFERIVNVPFYMSGRSVAEIVLLTVLAPLSIGILVRAMVPALAERSAKRVGRLATALLILSLIPVSFVSFRIILSLVGNGTLLSLATFALVGYGSGYEFGGTEPENRRALALAAATRHPAIAAAIAHANFPQQKEAVPAIALYLIVSAIVTRLASKPGKPKRVPTETEGRLAA